MDQPKNDILPLRFALLGPPGSGKGTQCARIAAHFGVEHISAGDMLRREKEQETEVGAYLRDNFTLKAVAPLGLELIADRVRAINASPAVPTKNGYVIDGSPKVLDEVAILAAQGVALDFVIELVVPPEVLQQRVAGRMVHSESGRVYHATHKPPAHSGLDDVTKETLSVRSEDSPDVLRKRLNSHNRYSSGVSSYFKERAAYIEIDGSVDEEAVFAQISAVLSDRLRHPRPPVPPPPSPIPPLSPLLSSVATRCSARTTAALRQRVHTVSRSVKSADTFPGTQPTTLCDSNFSLLTSRSGYSVSPKADGERALLLVTESGLFLIDRKMDAWQILSAPPSAAATPSPPPPSLPPSLHRLANTLLDCEIAPAATALSSSPASSSAPPPPAPPPFLILLDILSASGRDSMRDSLSARHRFISSDICPTLAAALPPSLLSLRPQQHFPLSDIQRLLGLCPSLSAAPPSASTLPFPVDGLIFTPGGRYNRGYDTSLLKWKPWELNTIDLLIRRCVIGREDAKRKKGDEETASPLTDRQRQELTSSDTAFAGFVLASKSSALSYFAPVVGDQTQLSALEGTVVECAPVTPSSSRSSSVLAWRPLRPRTDKAQPNADWVAANIVASLGGYVEIETLLRRLGRR